MTSHQAYKWEKESVHSSRENRGIIYHKHAKFYYENDPCIVCEKISSTITHLPNTERIQSDQLSRNLGKKSLHFCFLPSWCTHVRIGLKSIKVRFTRSWKRYSRKLKKRRRRRRRRRRKRIRITIRIRIRIRIRRRRLSSCSNNFSEIVIFLGFQYSSATHSLRSFQSPFITHKKYYGSNLTRNDKTGIAFVSWNTQDIFIGTELQVINDAVCLVLHVSMTCATQSNISVDLKK